MGSRSICRRLPPRSFAVFFCVIACARTPSIREKHMTTPPEWRRIQLTPAIGFAVPPEAEAQQTQPIDSIFGLLRGPAYEIIYDYGRSGDPLDAERSQPGTRETMRQFGARSGRELSVEPRDSPWHTVRILQVQDGRNILTIRVSCTDETTCAIATTLFDSVTVTSD
jgi:hypothetical protein